VQADHKLTINILIDTILFNCDSFNLNNVVTILFTAVWQLSEIFQGLIKVIQKL